jgi:hypothetical protein
MSAAVVWQGGAGGGWGRRGQQGAAGALIATEGFPATRADQA